MAFSFLKEKRCRSAGREYTFAHSEGAGEREEKKDRCQSCPCEHRVDS